MNLFGRGAYRRRHQQRQQIQASLLPGNLQAFGGAKLQRK
jgi:hypothetical protein